MHDAASKMLDFGRRDFMLEMVTGGACDATREIVTLGARGDACNILTSSKEKPRKITYAGWG